MLPEKTWKTESVLRLLLGVFSTICIGALVAAAVLKFNPGWDGETVKLLGTMIATLSFHGAALLWIHFFLKENSISWMDALGLNSPNINRSISLGIMAAIVVLPVAWALQQFSAWIMTMSNVHPEMQPPVRELQSAGLLSVRQIYLALVTLIAAPLAEEFLFRGIFYRAIKQAGFPKLALWGTSVLFALTHGNMAVFLPLLFFAIILTLLYEDTGNLLAPIVAHSCFNSANFVMLIWGKQIIQFFT